ncbi:MAG: AMMECR1 domain-containing protein [Candidatus Sericytochromatia bacterium]|nr:AMMECR1 domain-containing protein [Candidatus Sericytochromatia bacterium]
MTLSVFSAQAGTVERWRTVRQQAALRQALAKLPRLAALAYFDDRAFNPPASPPLAIEGGIFITLVGPAPDGHPVTRACWGSLRPDAPDLAAAVAQFGAAVLHEDYRQKPVQPAELAHLQFVISLVGPLVPVNEHEQLRPMAEGLYLTDGSRGAVLLPGEARTAAWQDATCRQKAGIAPKAHVYRYRFRTLVIEEPQR